MTENKRKLSTAFTVKKVTFKTIKKSLGEREIPPNPPADTVVEKNSIILQLLQGKLNFEEMYYNFHTKNQQ